MLRDLHWLRSPERIDYELAVFIYRYHAWSAATVFRLYPARRRFQPPPSPVVDIITHTAVHCWPSAFPVAGSGLWNSLPPNVTSAPTLTVLRNRLKTYFSFLDHFLPNCFRFIVLYTAYSIDLAALYLSHSK